MLQAALDLKTIVVVLVVNTSLLAVIWLIVWSSWRNFYELRFIAAGFCATAIGVWLAVLRGPAPTTWHIIFDSTIIKIGLVLVADGLARFLGQPRTPIINAACLIFFVAFYAWSLAFDPSHVAMRIHASTFIVIVMTLVMCRTLMADRILPPLLRWINVGLLLEHAGASVAYSLAVRRETSEAQVLHTSAWYFLENNLYLMATCSCLLLMVGVRLSSDLRIKNSALSHEISERQKLSLQLAESLKTEKALREEQRQFLRMVSHEFRTPLAIIDRAAEMIGVVLDKPPEAVTKRLINIDEGLRRLVSLIDRFLATERFESGVLQIERIDIANLFADLERHFDGMEAARRLRFQMAGELPSYWGDPDMLITVLINLTDNALKYSPDHNEVEISARMEEASTIVMTVKDKGIGIPTEDLSQIGRRFFRASNTVTTTGTGLGLYNSRCLLDYHKGTLHLQSCETGGTIVTIRLPLPGISDPAVVTEGAPT
jgi:two-component system OmpR family sensor kinase